MSPYGTYTVKTSRRIYIPPLTLSKLTVLLKNLELDILVICKNLLTMMIISRNDSNNDYNMHMYKKNKFTIISIFKYVNELRKRPVA